MFVTLEGPEGAGKSSVIGTLAETLRSRGQEVLLTREPGGSSIGKSVRQILLEGGEVDARAELMLFLADRAQHVAEIIRPALAKGHVVLCDRFTDSTLAYQGYGRDFDVQQLRSWNDFVTGGLKPDLTLLLDLDPSIGLKRLQNKDRLDSEPLTFHRKVREGFLEEAGHAPERWVVLDASKALDHVTAAALEAVLHKQATHV